MLSAAGGVAVTYQNKGLYERKNKRPKEISSPGLACLPVTIFISQQGLKAHAG